MIIEAYVMSVTKTQRATILAANLAQTETGTGRRIRFHCQPNGNPDDLQPK